MAKHTWGVLVAFGLGLAACGSEADHAASAADDPGAIDPESARYEFVGTADGMSVDVVSGANVQTFVCPGRSCTSLCNDCAAAACEATGGTGPLCESLISQCNESCSCDSGNCGFPVCAADRRVCYIDSSSVEGGGDQPRGPEPDPSPMTALPGAAAGAQSESSRPAD